MVRKIYLVLVLLALGSYNVFAEGYAINVQGNKQIGMGHTGVALNWDASSLQFNPGALATMPMNYSFTAGTSLTFIKNKFTGVSTVTEESDTPAKTPFYFYGAGKLSERLAVGLGVYTPFGNSLEWGDDWSGRYLVQNISLKSFFIQPTLSVKVADWLSIGAGPIIAIGNYELNKAIPQTPLPDGSMKLEGNTVEYGYNIGIFLQPTEALSFGVSYRSNIDMNAEGDATPAISPDVIAGLQAAAGGGDQAAAQQLIGLTSDEVKATLPLPASFNIGGAYRINDQWLVSIDVNYVFWDVYDKLTFLATNSTFPTAGEYTLSEIAKDWENSLTYRIGTQYSPNEKLDLRAGFYYDETPTQEDKYTPETPGANKIGISAGMSYKINDKLSFDASLLYIEGEKRNGVSPDGVFAGEYKNTGFIPGFGLSYSF